MLYSVMLFLHILGTIAMFIAVGLTLAGMIGMLHAKKTSELRTWSTLALKADGLLPFSVIVIFLPALYLVITTWGWHVAWINSSIIALVIMLFMGPLINLRRLKGIANAMTNETATTPSQSVTNVIQDPILWGSVVTMSALAIAIVFLMTVKLAVVGCIIAFAITIVLGIIASRVILKTVKVA